MGFQRKISPDLQMRLTGLAVLLCTAIAAFIGVAKPLLAASRHERFINWYPEAAVILPVGSIFGLFFFVLGARAEGALKCLGRNRAAGIAMGVLLAVLAAAAFFITDRLFRSLGYS
jgi:lysylphosphatidylglycerol synthetase-like protein (DUF2156 family)